MAFQRTHYPANWPELAHAAKTEAQWRCSTCGLAHGALTVSRRNRLYRVVLSACHLDHDPANPTPRLAVFCQACHLRYDAFQRWRSRRRLLLQRMLAAGQLAFHFEDGPDAGVPADASGNVEADDSARAAATPLVIRRWPARTDITAAIYARRDAALGRPLTLIQARNIHHAAPEFRDADTRLARFLVALVEVAIAHHTLEQRRALILLDQPDPVTPVTAWHIMEEDAKRAVRRVTPVTRAELAQLLQGYEPSREAVVLLLTAADARLFIVDDQGGLRGPGIRPRPILRTSQESEEI